MHDDRELLDVPREGRHRGLSWLDRADAEHAARPWWGRVGGIVASGLTAGTVVSRAEDADGAARWGTYAVGALALVVIWVVVTWAETTWYARNDRRGRSAT